MMRFSISASMMIIVNSLLIAICQYNLIEEMRGWKLLKEYMDGTNSNCLAILRDKVKLKALLEDTAIVTLLRNLENIYRLGFQQVIKTLLLTVTLIRLKPAKMIKLLPFDELHIASLKPPNINDFDDLVLSKIVEYTNLLIRQQEETPEAIGRELECLTNRMLQLYHLIEYKSFALADYAKQLYWLIEERFYEVWVRMSKDLSNLDDLEDQQFKQFYSVYCQFCQYRRKIPKIKHRNLKSVQISEQINLKIEEKYKQIELQSHIHFNWQNKMNRLHQLISSDWNDE